MTEHVPLTCVYGGFVKDCMARLMQSVQTDKDFLCTGKTPKVGQRLEIQVRTGAGGASWCRLSGVVTEIDIPPREGALAVDDAKSIQGGPDGTREELAAYFGANHGQVIRGRATVNFDFYDRPAVSILPFNAYSVYDVTLVMNDNMECMWQLVSCVMVPSLDGVEWSHEHGIAYR
jgi:hypothetical protein